MAKIATLPCSPSHFPFVHSKGEHPFCASYCSGCWGNFSCYSGAFILLRILLLIDNKITKRVHVVVITAKEKTQGMGLKTLGSLHFKYS